MPLLFYDCMLETHSFCFISAFSFIVRHTNVIKHFGLPRTVFFPFASGTVLLVIIGCMFSVAGDQVLIFSPSILII